MFTEAKVRAIGYLGADPELRYSSSGKAYCRFSIASTRVWRNANEEQIEETVWIRCVCFAGRAEFANRVLAKGRPVLIEGDLQQDRWQEDLEVEVAGKTVNITVDRYGFSVICSQINPLYSISTIEDQRSVPDHQRAVGSRRNKPVKITEADQAENGEEEGDVPF